MPEVGTDSRAFVCGFSPRFCIAYNDMHDIADMHVRIDMHVWILTGGFPERACDPHENLSVGCNYFHLVNSEEM